MIACEAQSHEAYGTSPKLFFAFFGVIVETMRELLAADWSAEFDEAWRTLLVEIEDVIARGHRDDIAGATPCPPFWALAGSRLSHRTQPVR
jgi:hypothetical protein